MSKHNRSPRHSPAGEANTPPTEPIAQPPVATSTPIQETPVPTQTQKTQPTPAETNTPTDSASNASTPTAKQMAAMEEENQRRLLKLAEQHAAPPPPEPVQLIEVAAKGYDALHEAFRRHNEIAAAKKEYVPPPRTERQMSALEEELEAGRRAVARAEAQKAAANPTPPDLNKEGFTTPVYRPSDVVPDPITGRLGPYEGASDA